VGEKLSLKEGPKITAPFIKQGKRWSGRAVRLEEGGRGFKKRGPIAIGPWVADQKERQVLFTKTGELEQGRRGYAEAQKKEKN